MGKTPGKVFISEDLLTIRNLIGRPRRIRVRDSTEELLIQLKELGYRIEVLEKNKRESEKSITPKRKKQILFLLKNRKMVSEDVGRALGISRTRANEYLKFMEEEGILTSEKIGRKKFYMIKEPEAIE